MNVSGNVMTLAHFFDFYYLEALRAGLSMAKSANAENGFRRSFERLDNDVEEAFKELTATMAKRIFAYIWAACLGEARHSQGMVPTYVNELSPAESRSQVYNRFYRYEPTMEHMMLIRDLYAQDEWGTTFGGKNWLNIMNGMMLYGRVSDATFIDHAVDLEHNGGNIFTKSANATRLDTDAYSASSLRSFLNYKFSHDILNGEKRGCVSSKVYRLIVRYNNIVSPVNAIEMLYPSLEWLTDYSVKWGDFTLTTSTRDVEETQTRERYDDTCEICGTGIHSYSHAHVDGQCVCGRCETRWNRNHTTCENCDAEVHVDNTTWIDGEDKTFCDHCAEWYTQECEKCGMHYHNDNTKMSEDGFAICEDCESDVTCEECNELHVHDMSEHAETHKVEECEMQLSFLNLLKMEVS